MRAIHQLDALIEKHPEFFRRHLWRRLGLQDLLKQDIQRRLPTHSSETWS